MAAKAGSFQSMNLSKDILSGLSRMGYKVPTPVQRKALPVALAGMDIVCMSRTGSGKTCVFLLPVIEKIKTHDGKMGVRAIILSPTRELAMQTYKFAKDMAKFTDLRIAPIIGGDPLEPQFEMLADRPDIIIATPGRLMHMLREVSTFKLKSVQLLVFDEADRLFEMGFAEQLNEIIRECPANRQTLLFSATMPKMLVQFTRAGLRDPQLIRLEAESKLSDELRLAFLSVRSNEKISALLYLTTKIIPADQQTIIFTATRHHSEFIHYLLEKVGLTSTLVYGTMDQDARNNNLRQFRNGTVSYLVVTDLAARGIDVPMLNNVINYHFPPSPKLFVHRCGRAARQGRIGYAFSLIDPEELAYAMDVHLFLGKTLECPKAFLEEDKSLKSDGSIIAYDLTSMQPSMVHTGLIPQDCLDRETEYIRQAMADDSFLSTCWKICENAMKQYRRTRSEASKPAVKLARDVVKDSVIANIHPLIMGCDPVNCSSTVLDKASFVKHLQTFRPSQTVFETGIGFGTSAQAAKSVSKKGTKESHGVEIMRALRKEVGSSLQRNKVTVTDLTIHENLEDDEVADEMDVDDTEELFPDNDEFDEVENNTEIGDEGLPTGKIRLSKAARKKAKSNNSFPKSNSPDLSTVIESTESVSKKRKFQDDKYYMSYGTENENANYVESSMQPQSGLKKTEALNASMIESAILDIAPDDAIEMNKKKRMLRWDEKKRKFVKQSLQEMAESGKGAKRIRTESGVAISKSKLPAGEMYEKWKKKSRREIEIVGSTENDEGVSMRPNPKFRHNTKAKDELRPAHEIRSLQKKRSELKLKNLPKNKRNSIMGKMKKQKASKSGNIRVGTKAGQRKVKAVMR